MIQRLSSRLVAVAEKRLRSLRNFETITLGTFSVLIDVRVVCEDCGTHIDIRTLFTKGGVTATLRHNFHYNSTIVMAFA